MPFWAGGWWGGGGGCGSGGTRGAGRVDRRVEAPAVVCLVSGLAARTGREGWGWAGRAQPPPAISYPADSVKHCGRAAVGGCFCCHGTHSFVRWRGEGVGATATSGRRLLGRTRRGEAGTLSGTPCVPPVCWGNPSWFAHTPASQAHAFPAAKECGGVLRRPAEEKNPPDTPSSPPHRTPAGCCVARTHPQTSNAAAPCCAERRGRTRTRRPPPHANAILSSGCARYPLVRAPGRTMSAGKGATATAPL